MTFIRTGIKLVKYLEFLYIPNVRRFDSAVFHILIAEDDTNTRKLMSAVLRQSGYEVLAAGTGTEALELLETSQVDLLILDIMMPGMDGIEVIKQLRRESKTPVIMLTAKGDTFDKVLALELGADDYIVKPFSIDEMIARIQSVLRRYHKNMETIKILDIEIDVSKHRVGEDHQPISLTNKEYDLLLYLVQNKNIALYRDTLYEKVWDEEYGQTRTLDLHIQRLRKKLGWDEVIKTVYKVGYMLEVDDEVCR